MVFLYPCPIHYLHIGDRRPEKMLLNIEKAE